MAGERRRPSAREELTDLFGKLGIEALWHGADNNDVLVECAARFVGAADCNRD